MLRLVDAFADSLGAPDHLPTIVARLADTLLQSMARTEVAEAQSCDCDGTSMCGSGCEPYGLLHRREVVQCDETDEVFYCIYGPWEATSICC